MGKDKDKQEKIKKPIKMIKMRKTHETKIRDIGKGILFSKYNRKKYWETTFPAKI